MLHEFLQCLLGEEAVGGVRCMSIPTKALYVFVSDIIQVLGL
jgi:hypothetical protein